MTASGLRLPIESPTATFALMLVIIFLVPILLKRIRIPSIAGLIVAGIVIGPHGLNLLERSDSIILFGTVGLLYLMFLAGLDLDIGEFRRNRNRSLLFGALTFLFPLATGLFICLNVLHYGWLPSLLISSMFSTHTLISYPIASRLGIIRNEAVMITVGGTIITDTAVLLLLGVILGVSSGDITPLFWWKMAASLAVFSLLLFWVFPRVGRWFFRNVEGERTSPYLFVLAMVFTAAVISELAGIEPIIGAFMAGLALNRLIPHTSPLMSRVEFTGNALFIPFFLVSTGMLVDLRILTAGPEALTIAFALTAVALAGKWLAAFFTEKVFGYSVQQRNLIFGLSASHAAATLAVILTGYKAGLIDDHVLNGTIVLILVTCLVSSFMTEYAGKKLAFSESDISSATSGANERILVPIANPATIGPLMDFALGIKSSRTAAPVHPLMVIADDNAVRDRVIASHKALEGAIVQGAATETKVQVLTRVDVSASSGIIRAAKETMITDIVMGWSTKSTKADRLFFGTILESVLHGTWQRIYVCRFVHQVGIWHRIIVLMPENIEFEPGTGRILRKMLLLARRTKSPMLIFAPSASQAHLREMAEKRGSRVKILFKDWAGCPDLQEVTQSIEAGDLLVLFTARKGTVSYSSLHDGLAEKVASHFAESSLVIVYPEQVQAWQHEAILPA